MAQIVQLPREPWHYRALNKTVLFFSRPDDHPVIQVEFFKIGMMSLFLAVAGIIDILSK